MAQVIPRTMELIEQGIAQGLHLGAQVYVSQRGRVIADVAIGQSSDGIAMSTDTVNLWMSSGKPVTAVAIMQLWERGLLDLDDPIAKHIPEFGVRGKEKVTVRHVLTHTGGFRAVMGLRWGDSFDEAVAKVCDAPLEPRWVPGRTAGYHAASGWYILAELVRRLDGRPFEVYVREAIFLPAGMDDCWIGMPAEMYWNYGQRIGVIYDTSTTPPKPAEPGNSEADSVAVRPGANARGPINQLGRFYERLVDHSSSVLLRSQTVEAMAARHRTGIFDQTFKHVLDMGLGVIVNSNQYGEQTVPYGYGPHAGLRTFGHSGQESSCAFCDPDASLVVAWMCNGMPGAAKHADRQRRLNQAIYEDVA